LKYSLLVSQLPWTRINRSEPGTSMSKKILCKNDIRGFSRLVDS
jgi:hypothetical protein